jgi:hypothetical protein
LSLRKKNPHKGQNPRYSYSIAAAEPGAGKRREEGAVCGNLLPLRREVGEPSNPNP